MKNVRFEFVVYIADDSDNSLVAYSLNTIEQVQFALEIKDDRRLQEFLELFGEPEIF
ncbi:MULTISPECIES: hypothetical protein [Moraxella]|uniref:Uncharacterized protein n=1 Tax=Moraxella lacunata TaxID=477 RepID=A0A378QDH6_MORLA|nr:MULTISPECIES: hypothetical protein [Moraxella]MBE9578671.1 hypothetical protein [Moraxella sp. K1664]MBE9587004.1 hypothetical protein [Moraxella sp. K1630]MBE9595242.1 hypothetical protein [Moraxella sp. K2450]MDH9218945.1 hypothetical protein [Moraxella lacunata]STY98818.1 Uncharacterised protein [Moraxella lacunata]